MRTMKSLTVLMKGDMVMFVAAFWNDSRRKYLAGLLANLSLISFGALGTSEVVKLGLLIELVIGCGGALFIVLGIYIHPNLPEGGK